MKYLQVMKDAQLSERKSLAEGIEARWLAGGMTHAELVMCSFLRAVWRYEARR